METQLDVKTKTDHTTIKVFDFNTPLSLRGHPGQKID
jgi:hypothetical protein